MQKEKLFMNSCSLGMEFQSNEQIANSFLNGNWDNSMDQSDPFESTLSSIVSSPAASNGPAGDSFVIRELIGRIGNICNSGEICPQSYIQAHNNNNSTNTSCYTSPLNSPPKIRSNSPITDNHLQNPPSLAPFATDPGFAERAAALSCFGLNEIELSVHRSEFGKLSTDKSINIAGSRENNKTSPQDGDKKLSRLSRSTTPENNAESSASEQIPKGQNDANARKRKSTPKTKATDAKMVAEKDESDGKRSKQDETENAKAEPNDGSQKDNSKPPEPLKDYIHVRARRGQATDSHSLAERVGIRKLEFVMSVIALGSMVRREKISERMKFLQDLVPGCNKVTGKAVMLDEIINYVQSLQRQVEFLSMKLATVNPRMDFNMDALVSKDMLMLQSRGSGQHTLLYPIDSSPSAPTPTFPFGYQPHQGLPLHGAIAMANNAENQFLVNPLNSALQFPPINGYVEAASQVPSFWEDDLHSLVQMGFNRNQNQPQSFPGSMAATQMKIEL